jgi:sec-independent protein translocase protein TatB
MFDIGFSELFVIGVVALVVIGPERLPKVARTVGHLFGRLQRYVSQVKSDISREMDAAELSKVKTEFETAARSFKADVETSASDMEREMREAQGSIERELAGKSEPESPPAAATEPSASEPSPQMELGIDPATPAPPPSPRP